MIVASIARDGRSRGSADRRGCSGSGVGGVEAARVESSDEGTQNRRQPAQEEMEVVAGGGEDGIDAVAVWSFEVIAAHAVLGLEMADDGLDGGASLHLAADGGGDAADLAGDPDPELVWVVVAAIALVDMDAAGLDAGKRLEPGEDGPERVSIVGVPMQRLGMEDELAALG